jgi:hypothetical protein
VRSLQLRVLGLGFLQDGGVGVGVFPEREEILVGGERPACEHSNRCDRSRIGVSRWYAGPIREGYRPHPRHWLALAKLVDVVSEACVSVGSYVRDSA